MSLVKFSKVYYYLKRNGIKRTVFALEEKIRMPYDKGYAVSVIAEEEAERQRQKEWREPVTFSILVPAYETKEEFLSKLITSLKDQTYPFWELIIADAGKTEGVKRVCEEAKEPRIRYVKLKENKGISENTNEALSFAKGEYTGLLDHDDFLTSNALYEMAKAIEEAKKEGKEPVFLYSDEDKCDKTGEIFFEPHRKLDFNFDLLLTNNYICHFLVVQTEEVKKVKLRKEYDGAQDFDLVLRLCKEMIKAGKTPEEYICHVPKILYHWRCHQDSTAANPRSKAYAYEAGKRAIASFCEDMGWKVTVRSLCHLGFYRVDYHGGIFLQRKDIAAVGGKEVRKGKITGSIFDEHHSPLFEQLPARYSGYMHRAVLTQNASYLDVEKWKIRPEVKEELDQLLEKNKQEYRLSSLKKRELLCMYLREKGYRLYWDPEWRIKE